VNRVVHIVDDNTCDVSRARNPLGLPLALKA